MNTKDYANQLLRILEQAKADGIKSIATDNLISLVKETANEPKGELTAAELEHYKATLQNVQAINIELFKSTVTAGQKRPSNIVSDERWRVRRHSDVHRPPRYNPFRQGTDTVTGL